MKKILTLAAGLLLLFGCRYYEGDPTFADDEMPYIYSELNSDLSTAAGQPITLSVRVSPADGSVATEWKVDGVSVSKDLDYTHTFTEAGMHEVIFTATRNGLVNQAKINVTVL